LVKAITKPENLDIAPFAHPIRQQLLSALTNEQLADGMHIVETNGEIRTGADALPQLLSKIAPAAKNIFADANAGSGLQALVRNNYTFLSEHRGKLARFVPNLEPVERISV
jgi:hypothetical protein